MTIRYTCVGCGSLLKIKDDLAGTDGKCPKCKLEFVIPDADDGDSAEHVIAISRPVDNGDDSDPEDDSPPKLLVADDEVGPEKLKHESHATLEKVVKPASKSETVAEKPDEDLTEEPVEKPTVKTVEKSEKREKAEKNERSPKKDNPFEKALEKQAAAKAAQKKSAERGDDFDPADFLMGDDAPHRPAAGGEDFPDPEEDRKRFNADGIKPKKQTKPPSSGTIPATGGISAAAHAKEMMMKAMEDSRTHAGEMPRQEERRDGFDFAGFFKEYGVKGGAGLVFGLILTWGLYAMFDSMMSTKLKMPPLGYVTGTVKLDGAPLPGATVYFAPLQPEIADSKKERARTSIGITDDKGNYRMTYIGRTEGVAVGKCRVWLDLIGPKGQVIPANYTEAVMQVREVKSGRNEFSFDMKTE